MGNLQQYGDFTPEAEAQVEGIMHHGEPYKVEVGQHVLRFLPAPRPGMHPVTAVMRHFVSLPGKDSKVALNCVRIMGHRFCPVCANAEQLNAAGNVADQKLAKDIAAGKLLFANVVDRRHPERGPQVVKVTRALWTELEQMRKMRGGESYFNPLLGYDVTISRTGQGFDTTYRCMPGSTSPLSKDAAQAQAWIEQQFDHASEARLPSDEEIYQKLGLQRPAGAIGAPPSAVQPDHGGRRATRTAQDDAVDGDYEPA